MNNLLWHNNPALVQLLGLCPLLAVSNSIVTALGLGLATIFVIACSNLVVSLLRPLTRHHIRIPVFVVVIATLVTATELLLHAWFEPLYQSLGIFLPLIVTNCMILARAEVFASKNRGLPALLDGLVTGTGFAAVLVLLGGLRELVGRGTLFDQLELLFGPGAWGGLAIGAGYPGLLLASLPAGAFIGLALLIAAKNRVDAGLAQRTSIAARQPSVANT